MAFTAKKHTINLIDSDESISDRNDGSRKDPKKKRRLELDDDFAEKIHWTDESDSVPVKPKKRRAKRKSTGNNSKPGKADKQEDDEDDHKLWGIPEYLHERRLEFNKNKQQHHEAGLMLPPEYSGIIFDETNRLEKLAERPEFDERSGIKPSRPYEDIELPQSAGFIPASIARYLRDYQVEGVRFLHRKFVYQEGAILGDDMGLGKTVQVAAFLTAAFGKTGDERDAKRMRQMRYHNDRWYPRVLIICPGSLIMNWKNELNRWGWWHADVYHGANKEDVLGTARAGLLEIMITTYATYKNSRSSINMVKWDAVIADECHCMKEQTSETTKAMAEVNALCRIGLTGTAIQNRYEELWTLLDWTNPGHFGTSSEWRDTISRPLAVGQSHEATMAQLSLARQTAEKLVQNLLPQYFLRRMKSLIAHQLPKKTDRVVFCPLTDLQREAYENFVGSDDVALLREVSNICEHGNAAGWCCRKKTSQDEPWQKIIFPSMIVMQKLANHLTLLVPQTTDLETKQDSELRNLQICVPDDWKELYSQRDQIRSLVNPEFCGKWKVLKKLLKFWHGNGDKVLVFSHSVRLLRILQHLFHNTSYNVSYLDGSLSYEARQEVVDTFNADQSQFVFLISTKAGGVGLNITSANKVVIVDPHWNPSYDLQAQDRAYRIGQTRDVEVFRLISLGTVEEIVYARQIYKQQQANIGYTASTERRYFKGVQQDTDRKGEIFGLTNIFTYHTDSGLLRDIVNKTNIAEARAGVGLAEVDMEKAAGEDEDLGIVKKEDGDGDGGMSQLAELLKSKDPNQVMEARKIKAPKVDAVQAILTSAGVEYTHDNSEVIGSSKVEEQLSRRATTANYPRDDLQWSSALFANQVDVGSQEMHKAYNPPEDVQLRQFCEMAREFGFANATEFALIVEGWSREERQNCLDTFYKNRKAKLVATSGEPEVEDSKADVKDVAIKSEHVKSEDEAPSVKREKLEQSDISTPDATTARKARNDEVQKVEKREDDKKPVKDEKETIKREEDRTWSTKIEDDCKISRQEEVKFKVEGSSKRTSIFLSDDDEDDEL